MNINNITPDKHSYLQIITHIANAPKRLYYAGKLPTERQITIAVVGSRKPTRYGIEVTRRLAYDLAKKGIIIASGLAMGVDSLAHQSALDAGGTTIAVLANGLPDIRPAVSKRLGEAILAADGALITEYETDYVTGKWSFVERDRLISGISDAVLITEATVHSGSLHTAAFALEQNREVFVVPGNITSPLSAGCNSLLKQGAHVVTCAEDILEVVAPELLSPQSTLPLGSNALETQVIQLLQSGLRDGEQLQRETDAPASDLNTALTMLEINGAIKPLGANQWTLK